MHRIVTPDGRYRQSKWLRWSGAASYAFWGAAGIVFLIAPDTMKEYGTETLVMAGFLLIGSLCAGIGAATERWMGEFIGLPLLMAAFPALGILNLREDYVDEPWLAVGEMLICFGITCAISARWRTILAIERMVHHVASGRNRDAE